MSRALFYFLIPPEAPVLAPSPSIPIGSLQNVPTKRTARGALLDQLLDPETGDYVDDNTDGSWVETADSRTIVLIMFETWLGKSYSAPGDGSKIPELLASGAVVTPEMVQAEAIRMAAILERDGVIADFQIRIKGDDGKDLVNEKGEFFPLLSWIDVATASIVDVQYAPFQGGN